MATVVIGTAGHIDHGKTTLLLALTGIDADRLPEEQARGMTIDVGYAHLTFDDGVELDFVDVPGHDRLIGNMLVGAGEVDAAMLVVAADDGPRPQTIEHLGLLDALGISDGLAVVTKADLVDEERVRTVSDEMRDRLAVTSLSGIPILAVSSVTGAGVDELRGRLRAVVDAVQARWRDRLTGSGDGPTRIAVDRVFGVKGRGAVVTGSLRGGRVRAGDVLRREPGGEAVRIRELQVHGLARAEHDGGRTALNLAGLSAEALRRGDVLTLGDEIRGTTRVLVAATVDGPGRARLHIGTDQIDARVRPVAKAPGFALADLERPIATFPGDRGVLREPGRGAILGGVRVLDLAPPRGASRRRVGPERLGALAEAALAANPAAIDAALVELHGARVAASDAPVSAARSLALAGDVREALIEGALEAVAAHHRATPISTGLPLPRARAALVRRLRSLATVERRDADAAATAIAELLDGLVADGRLTRQGDTLRDPARGDAVPGPLAAAMDRLEAALGVPAPPPLGEAAAAAGCPPEGIRALQADGRIVRLGPDLAWSTAAYQRLAAAALGRARGEPLTPAAFRDATGTSRKYVLAILEDLDRRGILERTPAGHIAGPRAPRREAVPAEPAR